MKKLSDLNFDKLRISVLWLLAIAAFFGFVTLVKDEVPAILSNISLHSSQEVGSLSAVLMLFTVLSLILKGSINRWTNIIAGTIIGIGTFIAFVDAVTENLYG